ncbi:LOW QUALITY PROTEIN: DNA topoisomerase 2-binding protein 1-A [Uranotaenia lowii]|uniref:LOW QUALITY PROTEIN: DNA topoisomerase 2-binding protein 1-A n=1 Tax=Uranotaenia lowii TaxID=190385 RepID=UPI00247A0E17|nr:LOW QUALITY PROTEIN: DNA topoisomerase 2-binding protein 1-A [Uranotaenia lowii]
MSKSIHEQQLVKLYFVLKDGKQVEDATEDMQMAYSMARDHSVEELISWLDESECLRIRTDQLTKKHVFVFENFAGEAFEHIRAANAVLIGPRCLISCFLDNEAIPLGKYPVMTTAMRNLMVCSSGLKPEEKTKISQMVFYMGGCYLDILTAACTHLVASTVKSVKYEKAGEIKLKIMHPDWVKDVWEQSQKKIINASDAVFNRHLLPIFYSLTITSTGLSTAKRNQIKQLIEDNGGKYLGAFKSEITDILILEKSSVGTPKFQGAVRCKKECLTPSWVIDSVEKGYALPVTNYEVRSLKSSTPTKDDLGMTSSRDFNPDCTQLSMISHVNSRNLTINESLLSATTTSQTGARLSAIPSRGSLAGGKESETPKYKTLLEGLNLKQVKAAGSFLDGCNIYLSGFTSEEKDKLNKILNTGGATRYDEISDGISHVIVGSYVPADFREMNAINVNPHVMTFEWLVKSMEQKSPSAEDDFMFEPPNSKNVPDKVPEPPSPASKKNLESMNSTFKRPELPPKFRLNDEPKPGPSRQQQTNRSEDDVLQQYMQKNTSMQLPPAAASDSKKAVTSVTQDSELESQFTEFMEGKTLFIYGFSEDDAMQIVSDCENYGGMIVDENYTDLADYILLPTCSFGEIEFSVKGRETVNCIWLETSIQDETCHPLQYYFEPILYGENDPKPLDGEVLVISTYSGAERNYLIALGGILGANVEDRLVRKAAPIVICKEPSGAKYDAAIKWDLTVVNADWLRECLKQKRRVNEELFLVGKSICSPKNVTEVSEVSNRLSDLPEFPRNACLPTTSTDDVDIDSVMMGPPVGGEPSSITASKRSSVDLPKENKPDNYKYISVEKTKDASEVEYEFKRLSSPELRKISYEERQVYSQELHQYEDLIQSQRDQRKPFDPGHAVDSPFVLKHRRLSTLSGVNSPVTPNSTTGASEYEQLSVTQRVMEFETPIRDTLYKVLKEAEEAEKKITPRTRRMNELLATPSTGQDGHVKTPTLPDCMTKPVTPYGFRPDASPENHLYHKRKLQFWDQFYRPKQNTDRRKSTPLSEIKRRFWRENLGDEYVDYVESKFASTQFQPYDEPVEGDQKNQSKEQEDLCQPSTSRAGTSRGRDVSKELAPDADESGNDSRKSTGSNVSEKRPREDDDDDEDCAFDGDAVPEPAPKRLNIAEMDNLKRLSDLINTNKNSAKKTRKFRDESKETQYSELPRFDSEMVGEDAPGVGWRDPTEFDCERRQGDGTEGAPAVGRKKDQMSYRGTPVFALSGVNEDLRMELSKKIQELGGELSTKPNEYDPICTHILCGKPNRGEKILSGIAAGKWLLCTKYIDDSCSNGYFLNEEDYEWGNPKAQDLPALEGSEKLVSKAAYNWRIKIARETCKHDGVFTGFRVLLLAPKKEQFIRLLKSGGGFVIDVEPPFVDSEHAMTATHCFVDVKKVKISSRDHKALAEAGIAVMSIMYLNAYLTSETLPDPGKYRLAV